MKKFGILLFGTALLGTSLYGLFTQSYYVELLINLTTPFVIARIVLVLVLVLYVSVPGVRHHIVKILLGLAGMAMLALGLTAMYSPTIVGHEASYIPLGDVLTLIEG